MSCYDEACKRLQNFEQQLPYSGMKRLTTTHLILTQIYLISVIPWPLWHMFVEQLINFEDSILNKWYILKYFVRFFIFLHKNICLVMHHSLSLSLSLSLSHTHTHTQTHTHTLMHLLHSSSVNIQIYFAGVLEEETHKNPWYVQKLLNILL